MALIKCDECGRRISDKSLSCPGCGYPTHLNRALREKSSPQPAPQPAPLTQPAAGTDDALAEFEASLGNGPRDPRSNERKKLWLYFAVLVLLLAGVGGCYYYATVVAPATDPADTATAMPADAAMPDTVTLDAADSTAVVETLTPDSLQADEKGDTLSVQASPFVRQL